VWVEANGIDETGTAQGFRNGVEIYSRSFTVGPDYSLLTLNFTNIDTITFNQPTFNLVIDDITVNQQLTAAPEPVSLTLLGLGSLGLLGCGRRRRKRAAA
jgi:hypothetical protein